MFTPLEKFKENRNYRNRIDIRGGPMSLPRYFVRKKPLTRFTQKWIKADRFNVGGEIVVPLKINVDVLSLFRGGGQYTLRLTQKPEKLMPLITLAFSLASFVARLNKNTANKQNQTDKPQTNLQRRREFFKEVTRQSNSKDCFSQIGYYFGNKLSSLPTYYSHRFDLYHNTTTLSSLFRLVLYAKLNQSLINHRVSYEKLRIKHKR